MFADRSMSHVAAHWSDGQELHYDSWDCVFVYAEEHSELLESAQVIDPESSLKEPRWLDASTAWYLYDTTERVAGSMPPFTAAFSSREAAVASQQELGGELLDFSALRGKWGAADPAGSAAAGSESAAGSEEAQPSERIEAQARPAEPDTAAEAAETSAAEGPLECPYCGMLPANSGTHIAAEWSDGAEHHYDCFDCMFNHLKESSATLANVKVSRYGSPGSAPDWLDAASAVFLYDTKRIKGSMPPYTAAFSDEASAMAAQAELGGELVNWTALRAKWGL
jgi:nitrous oxide reductase accessory protein NosL